jgi:hypothetical protein
VIPRRPNFKEPTFRNTVCSIFIGRVNKNNWAASGQGYMIVQVCCEQLLQEHKRFASNSHFKAYSHIPYRSPAVPQICLSESDLSRPWQGRGRVTAWGRWYVLISIGLQRRHVGDMPEFDLFLLPREVPGSLLSEAYQSQMQVASVKQSNFCHGREAAYYFGART